ncbi:MULTISPECIES: aminotransferase class V-fold PLP-dependent enzyme [unclassified Paenibacillus]|uniref:aminotransferase class V-fold PLP-dependent enzyme n=1 Tax=Paenibacillus sp. FSL P4-0338 TaxID=2921635 RepID=UPI0003E2B27A|nr:MULTISPECIES: aminotransferase class V-fold PLP-dependent enzyme [unclassified Paenibacillus]ETT54271.1 cysteine desulfurase [Paenibacillus sp. FSL R7-269]OMF91353.1 selenocysteine lyase [Paenibacillus sp. FSL R7-0337]
MLSIHRTAAADAPSSLQEHFAAFREHTVGCRHLISTPYGRKPLLYADWTASGRLYEPIERKIQESFGPYVSNPHTDSNTTGLTITLAYQEARSIIRQHVNAAPADALLFCGNGTTGAVNKLLRIMGLKLPEWLNQEYLCAPEERPVIFVSHMEHHSNLLPWQESFGDVVTVPSGPGGEVDLQRLGELLTIYQNRRFKIGSFTACSNVTGIETPYHQLASLMHRHGGVCFVDFAASAPYQEINMHPAAPQEKLDAIFFSPHKFLGGPGTGGVLLFDTALSTGRLPDEPGGGTVVWVNRWGGRRYIDDVEVREDGGTPGFLQAIRTALCVKLKEQMNGTGQYMIVREQELCRKLLLGLAQVPGCSVLEGTHRKRHGIVSFTLKKIHYNLAVRLLNDRFGIQARGGCSCAGPYGHQLLGLNPAKSQAFIQAIHAGDQSLKPGWVRLSLHPIMTGREVEHMIFAVQSIVSNIAEWSQDYRYNAVTNSWIHTGERGVTEDTEEIRELFVL